jgi:hypothetical protein
MSRLPLRALVRLLVAAAVLLVALVISLQPVPDPSWGSEPGAGKALQLVFCVAPLALFGALLGLRALVSIVRSLGR